MTATETRRSTTIPEGVPDVRCTDVLQTLLKGYEGIREADFDIQTGRLRLVYDPRILEPAQALHLVQQAGTQAYAQVQRCLRANTATCQECVADMGHQLAAYFRAAARGEQVSAQVRNGHIEVRLATPGPEAARAEVASAALAPQREDKEPKAARRFPLPLPRTRGQWEILLTLVTLLALVAAEVLGALGWEGFWTTGFFVVAYLAGGYYGLLDGLDLLFHERKLDVNLLMILAALGAAIIGQPAEGAVLLFLFSLSNTLQTYAMDRSRRAIEALLDLRPPVARVRRNGEWVEVPVEDLKLHEIVMVRPGERFPIDGEVVAGHSEVDQSPITGESVPVPKQPGDKVFAGTVNGTGTLEVKVTRLAEDTTLARIVKLVEEAQATKARTQRMLEEFEQRYALFVLAAAVVLSVLPPLFLGTPFPKAFYRAMVWLVVASPCALVISTPASILSAIANAARNGVLFKGGVHLERAALIQVVAFDKTGTLTEGKLRVTDVVPLNGVPKEELLRLAAAVESRSEHPIAQAIVRLAQEEGLEVPESTAFRAQVGQGVEGQVDGRWLWIGNARLFQERAVSLPAEVKHRLEALEAQGKTTMVVYDASQKQWLGLIAVADTLRPNAAQVIRQLKALGVKKVIMLTGDHPRVAANIAQQVGVDEVYAGLLPKDKMVILNEVREKHGFTAMVGDGVNDAPALASADIGIAMGGAGTDVALETADVVLMGDDLDLLPFAIGLARKARRIIWQNITFSLAVIVLLVVLTFGMDLPLPLGVVGHEGSTVIVVLNGLRLLRYCQRKPQTPYRPTPQVATSV